MNLRCAILLSACGISSANAAAPITGRVTFQGVPPPEIVIPMSAECARLQTNQPTTRHYVVATHGGFANVFVSIRAEFDAKLFPVPTNVVRMQCVACQVEPYILAARAGQPVSFENDSSMMENFHFTPKLNSERNLAGLPGRPHIVTFDTPEDFIRFKGDVHPWFFGYVCVVGHPCFAVTGPDGTFSLPAGLPDGTYTLAASHLKAGSQKKQITVRGGRAAPVEFTFTVPKR